LAIQVVPSMAQGDGCKRQGLTPSDGTSVHGKARISKRGNREVRKRLFEATLSAARYNPSIRSIYRRLKENGKPDKVSNRCRKETAPHCPCHLQERRVVPRSEREGGL